MSTCVKCGGRFFEIKEVTPAQANFKQTFVQCTSCGTPVGVIPFYDPGVLAKQNQETLSTIEGKLDHVVNKLREIEQELRRRRE
jgi:hypothetical protein